MRLHQMYWDFCSRIYLYYKYKFYNLSYMLDFVVLHIESVIWGILNGFVDSYLYVK